MFDCIQEEFVNIKIVFITHLDYISYNHYLQHPTQMIERQICKRIDQKRNLKKTLDKMPEPSSRYMV